MAVGGGGAGLQIGNIKSSILLYLPWCVQFVDEPDHLVWQWLKDVFVSEFHKGAHGPRYQRTKHQYLHGNYGNTKIDNKSYQY